jgi:hypothetical protein
MSELTLLFSLLILGFALFLTTWLNQQIYQQLYSIVYRLTASHKQAYTSYFLLMLPGIFVHEGSHWLVARLFGLKPGKFRVWPKPGAKSLRLGSVTFRSGGIWLDSIVGLAPLLIGSLLLAWIGQAVFQSDQMLDYFLTQGSMNGLRALASLLSRPDGLLWSYLLFTIANGMMPSASDREPLGPVLTSIVITLVLFLLLGLPVTALTSLFTAFLSPLQSVVSTLLLTIALDVAVLVALAILSVFVFAVART